MAKDCPSPPIPKMITSKIINHNHGPNYRLDKAVISYIKTYDCPIAVKGIKINEMTVKTKRSGFV